MKRIIFMLNAVLLAGQAFPSAELFLPVPRSGRRSVRYFADHDLKQRDPKAEYAVVMVHGVNGGCSDCTGTRSMTRFSSLHLVSPSHRC